MVKYQKWIKRKAVIVIIVEKCYCCRCFTQELWNIWKLVWSYFSTVVFLASRFRSRMIFWETSNDWLSLIIWSLSCCSQNGRGIKIFKSDQTDGFGDEEHTSLDLFSNEEQTKRSWEAAKVANHSLCQHWPKTNKGPLGCIKQKTKWPITLFVNILQAEKQTRKGLLKLFFWLKA